MSTDTYIDVFDSPAKGLDCDELINQMGVSPSAAADVLRIGYISAIRGLSFNWFEWLQAYARATDVITPAVIEGVVATYRHLQRVYQGASSKRAEWLRSQYGASMNDFPFDDIVAEAKLVSFLQRHQGKHWRLRVD